jgi:hypothetical protein
MVFAAPSKGRPPWTVPGAAHEVRWVALLEADGRDHPIALCDWLQTKHAAPRVQRRLRMRNTAWVFRCVQISNFDRQPRIPTISPKKHAISMIVVFLAERREQAFLIPRSDLNNRHGAIDFACLGRQFKRSVSKSSPKSVLKAHWADCIGVTIP